MCCKLDTGVAKHHHQSSSGMHLATPRLVQSPPSLPFAGTSSLRGLRDANVPCALWFGCGWNDASLPALPLETLIRRPQTHIAIAVDESPPVDSHRSCRRKRVSSFYEE